LNLAWINLKHSIFLLLIMLLALIASASPAVSAGPEHADQYARLDSFINAHMDKHDIQGIALAVTSGSKVIYLKGYGTAGKGRPMTPQTPMYIGSQSKSFTALAVAQLAEQGLIKLSSPVQAYLPWFQVADPGASRKITVSHLLHHTSGLSDAGFLTILPDNATNEEAVRALATAKLTAPVGSKFQYFNLGYSVLAVIIQAASGMSYEEYLQVHILDSLEMARTYTDPLLASQNGLSQGYSRLFGFVIPQPQPHHNFEVSAGYIISTAEDMAKYVIALTNAGEYQGRQLLSPAGFRLLFTPVQGYGMGWFVEREHIYHGGANETFKTFVDIYPENDQAFVLLINQGYMLDHYISAVQIRDGVEAILFGRLAPPVREGWSVQLLGWGLLGFVALLSLFHLRNMLALRGWAGRARGWSARRRAWDIALSFLIPTLILVIVFSQVKAFFGDRFNLTFQMLMMFRTLADISVLMVLGTLPDYAQGIAKLVLWNREASKIPI
jgi:CubicO group peptidase (beta-lactamase class C family)